MYRDPLAGPIPRSDDAPACQLALSKARGACLLPATNRNADSIASSALTKCVSGKAKSRLGVDGSRPELHHRATWFISSLDSSRQ